MGQTYKHNSEFLFSVGIINTVREVKCTKIYKLLISIIYKDTRKRMSNPQKNRQKNKTEPFLVKTKMTRKTMKRQFIILKIRLMECYNNDPIFLEKKKEEKNTSDIPSDSKATGKCESYLTSGTTLDSATFRRKIIIF